MPGRSLLRPPARIYCGLLLLVASMVVTSGHAKNGTSLDATRFPELKVVQEDGSPVRIAREDWPRAQAIVVTDAGWRNWAAERRKALDRWIGQVRDRAEWVAGWGFKLVDPASGAAVRWTPDMPEPADGMGKTKEFKQAWVSGSRAHNIGQILEAARLYRLTGEVRYAEWAASQIDFYAENYQSWPLRTWNGRARMMGQSLDEATSVITIVESVRLLGGQVGTARSERWREDLFQPLVANLRVFDQGVNNIALWHAVAMSLVGLSLENEALISEGLDGPSGVRALLAAGITADALWYEGSFAYNAYVLAALNPLFTQFTLAGRGDSIKDDMIRAQNLQLAPLQFRFDDGSLPNPGDSTHRLRAIDLGVHASVFRVLPTRVGLIEAARGRSWDSLLDPVELPGDAAPPLPPVVTANFPASRMAVLKSPPWQVFIHYGQLTQHHAQAEALSYELYFGATAISPDPGTVSYGSPLHENYFRRAVAHNVPLVDGEGQEGWSRGSVMEFLPTDSRIAVSQPAYRPGVEASRRLSISNGVFVDYATIRLTNPNAPARRLGVVFNTPCAFAGEAMGLAVAEPSAPPSGRGFDYWQKTTRRDALADWSRVLDCGAEQFVLAVRAPGPHRVYEGAAPATPFPSWRRAIYLETFGREASFELRLTPR